MDRMTERDPGAPIGSFVALGDSFTEGLNDPYPSGGYRGWADRVAAVLAAQAPGFGYANLAISGKVLGQVIAEQVPRAAELAPDLVSLAAGGNDILRGADVDALAARFERAVVTLQAAGGRVLIFTGFDPRMFPVIRLLRGRIATYDMHLRAIADHHGCDLVDLWSMRALQDPRAWSPDRLHLSSEGHRRVAQRTCEVLGPCRRRRRTRGRRRGRGRRRTGWRRGRRHRGATRRAAPSGWPRAARTPAGPGSTRCHGCAGGWPAPSSDSLDPKRPDLLPVDPGGLIR